MSAKSVALVPLQERRVNFYGDELIAVLVEVDGQHQIYVPVRPICEYLGLAWSSQLQRMRRDDDLSEALRGVSLLRSGASQRYEVICLQLEYLPGFLFGITTSKVRADLRPQVKRYKRDCYRVLWQAFQQGELTFAPNSSTVAQPAIQSDDPRVVALTEQIDTLYAIAESLEAHRKALLAEANHQYAVIETNQRDLLDRADHISLQLNYVISLLEGLTNRQGSTEVTVAKIDERTKKLSPAHERDIQGMVERIVRAMERRAPQGTPLAYATVYGRLKTRFRVGRYYEISDERFEEAMAYLREELRKVTGGEGPVQGSLFEQHE